MTIFRSATLLALAAQAAPVRYRIQIDFNNSDVSVLAPDFVTSTVTFTPPQVSGGGNGGAAERVAFNPYSASEFSFNIFFTGASSGAAGLPASWLTTPGTYDFTFLNQPASFTTEPVPEPAGLAALGLVTVAKLRRRKRA